MFRSVDSQVIKERINKRVEELLFTSMSGGVGPYVCLSCDELLKPREVRTISVEALKKSQYLLKPAQWNNVSANLAECYQYRGDCGDGSDDRKWMDEMLLSPRAAYIRKCFSHRQEGFSICSKCKHNIEHGNIPRIAIANNYCFGTPPTCLEELTEVELAMLTPVKTFGYCFAYTGGRHKKLKGSLSYYKVEMESIARAAMHLDVLGMHKNIVVILFGKMTSEQRRAAKRKSRVRVNKVLAALNWLILYNELWRLKNINLDEIRGQLSSPVLIDNSTSDDGDGNNNVEKTESFKVFFPDGTMSSTNGGQDKLDK